MAREYIKDRKNNPNYIKYHREYSKLWRAKNKKHTKDYLYSWEDFELRCLLDTLS